MRPWLLLLFVVWFRLFLLLLLNISLMFLRASHELYFLFLLRPYFSFKLSSALLEVRSIMFFLLELSLRSVGSSCSTVLVDLLLNMAVKEKPSEDLAYSF